MLEHPCPTEFVYLWRIYLDLAASRTSNGFGVAAISFSEMAAFAELTRYTFEPFEVRILRRVDMACISLKDDKEDERRKT